MYSTYGMVHVYYVCFRLRCCRRSCDLECVKVGAIVKERRFILDFRRSKVDNLLQSIVREMPLLQIAYLIVAMSEIGADGHKQMKDLVGIAILVLAVIAKQAHCFIVELTCFVQQVNLLFLLRFFPY